MSKHRLSRSQRAIRRAAQREAERALRRVQRTLLGAIAARLPSRQVAPLAASYRDARQLALVAGCSPRSL